VRAPFQQRDRHPDEREIRSLSDQSGVALADVRTLFRHELARLGMGAKIDSYLAVLTASNVRGMLRRTALRSEAALVAKQPAGEPGPSEQSADSGDTQRLGKDDRPRRRHVRRSSSYVTQDQSWEDDGGRVREAVTSRTSPATTPPQERT
jgi:hypothetical protein